MHKLKLLKQIRSWNLRLFQILMRNPPDLQVIWSDAQPNSTQVRLLQLSGFEVALLQELLGVKPDEGGKGLLFLINSDSGFAEVTLCFCYSMLQGRID